MAHITLNNYHFKKNCSNQWIFLWTYFRHMSWIKFFSCKTKTRNLISTEELVENNQNMNIYMKMKNNLGIVNNFFSKRICYGRFRNCVHKTLRIASVTHSLQKCTQIVSWKIFLHRAAAMCVTYEQCACKTCNVTFQRY